MPVPTPIRYTALEAANLLGVKGRNSQELQTRLVSRLVYLGYTVVCGRCCGSGEYSFNQTDGTRCFGCSGSGKKLQTLTPVLLAEAKKRIDAGELEPYFLRGKLIREVKATVKGPWEAWKASQVGRDYSANRTPRFESDEARNEHYDRFFASPLYKLNHECGEICKRASEIEMKIGDLHVTKDGTEIDAMLAEIAGMKERVEELDRQYVASLTTPVETKPVFAVFRYLGVPYFVRVSAATDPHKDMAREYLSKVLANHYYDRMIFDQWADAAPTSDFHDLYPRESSPREALQIFLTNLSESREVITNAIR